VIFGTGAEISYSVRRKVMKDKMKGQAEKREEAEKRKKYE
jgi:hypothetical protein